MPITLIAEIIPQNNGDFALLDDKYIRGSFHITASLTERNFITSDRRKWGMRVYVQSTDTVYVLQSDLITWVVDKATTQQLQDVYNSGNVIQVIDGRPFIIQCSDGTNILTVSNDKTVEFNDTLCGENYTSNITTTAITNATITVDTTDKTIYRAVQYKYTITNSDSSGYETGELFLIHDGTTPSLCAIMGSSIGVPCNATFTVVLSGYNLNLLITTDNSPFSRIVHLFKIALT